MARGDLLKEQGWRYQGREMKGGASFNMGYGGKRLRLD